MTSFDEERRAECISLIEEIKDFTEELNKKESEFISNMDDFLLRMSRFVPSDDQYNWIVKIHERVV